MKYFKFVGDPLHFGWDEKPVKNEVYSLKQLRNMWGYDNGKKVSKNVFSGIIISANEIWIQVSKPKKPLSEKIEKLQKEASKAGMKIVLEFGPEKIFEFGKELKEMADKINDLESQEPNQNWVEPTFTATNTKDEWGGVEFVIPNHNSSASKLPYKVVSVKNGFIQMYCPYSGNGEITQIQQSDLNPSTESAYVEQLKKEAHKRFGEIKEGDKFDRTPINKMWVISQIEFHPDYIGFTYDKDFDQLFFNNICIYESGKWATKLHERVEVKYGYYSLPFDKEYILALHFAIDDPNRMNDDAGKFLASQLEKYLNNEIN